MWNISLILIASSQSMWYTHILQACFAAIRGNGMVTQQSTSTSGINTLRPRQNGRHFADDIFKCTFLNENALIPIKISLKFVPKSSINNIPALVQIMAWRRPGDKPLSEPMMVSLPTHICVTRPQCVNRGKICSVKIHQNQTNFVKRHLK